MRAIQGWYTTPVLMRGTTKVLVRDIQGWYMTKVLVRGWDTHEYDEAPGEGYPGMV